MIITKDTTAEEFQQAHADAVHTIERYDDVAARRFAIRLPFGEPLLGERIAKMKEIMDALIQEEKQIRWDQRDRMNRVVSTIRHDSTADALAMLAMIPSPPDAWKGRNFTELQPADHPGLWNKTHWERLGFRPADSAETFARQQYRNARTRRSASCRLYDVSAVVPIKRRPRRAPADDAE